MNLKAILTAAALSTAMPVAAQSYYPQPYDAMAVYNQQRADMQRRQYEAMQQQLQRQQLRELQDQTNIMRQQQLQQQLYGNTYAPRRPF